jgi:hypothetical protein
MIGILIGAQSATFSVLQRTKPELLPKPPLCVSIMTRWRTIDFMFTDKKDLVNFHIAFECVVNSPNPTKSPLVSKLFKAIRKKIGKDEPTYKDKNVKAPKIIMLRILKERFKMIA